MFIFEGMNGKAQRLDPRMHKLEIELIKSKDPYRNRDTWLILEGAVKFSLYPIHIAEQMDLF